MNAARATAAVFLVAGLAAGSLAPAPPAPSPPVTPQGEHVLQADFHVHAFPGDGWLAPWELMREARRQGLDAVAITNHNQVLAARLGRWFRNAKGANGPILLIGDEVTARGYHMTAAGIEAAIDWRRSAADAIAQVHAQGGVAIAAHPVEFYWPAWQDAMATLDGAEVAHPLTLSDAQGRQQLQEFHALVARQRTRPLSAIGSTDYHVLTALGLCRTYVFARTPTADGILEAVREGRTVALDAQGVLYGDPGRRAFVERAWPAEQRGARPRTALEAVAAACAWLGLAGLLLLGRGVSA